MFIFLIFFQSYAHHLDLHSFPTRRSSDLSVVTIPLHEPPTCCADHAAPLVRVRHHHCSFSWPYPRDRKSTRLNSSHRCISYAVFCLKKKNKFYHFIS